MIHTRTIIMNPPYSLKWKPIAHEQYQAFGPMPTNAADFAFVCHGLYHLADGGTLIAVLPHGVLFRGAKEAAIRKKLIEKNLIDAVIGLPDKLFMNTSIPVCLLILKKDRPYRDILMMDASKLYEQKPKQNYMTAKHIQTVWDAYSLRRPIKKLANVVTLDEIRENEYNLNIPRYVDTFEPEPVVPLAKKFRALRQIDEQLNTTENEIYSMLRDLRGTNADVDSELQEAVQLWGEYISRQNTKADTILKKKHNVDQPLGMTNLFSEE